MQQKSTPNQDKDDRKWDSVIKTNQFNDYSLRIKKNNPAILGIDPDVNQYSGYLDIQSVDKHFFYWFFESRNDPVNDPLILWLNGGPGCSSMTGLFFELGPSSIDSNLNPVYNKYSWNNNASVIFLEQPIGVGYSYSKSSNLVSSTDAASLDVFVFLELFFQKFPNFLNNKFHLAGESYGGHYLPRFGSEIINREDRSFNLSSIMIGNGFTDALVQYNFYEPMACGLGGYKQVLTDKECDDMTNSYPFCAKLVRNCYKNLNAFSCVPAQFYCEGKFNDAYNKKNLNPYDIRKYCDEGENNDECYKEFSYIEDYLNLDYVKEALGSEVDKFVSCSNSVFQAFTFTGDLIKPHQQYVAELLDRDIPVLLYAGDKDYICNWLGNEAWSLDLDYKDHDKFLKEQFRDYYLLLDKNGDNNSENEKEYGGSFRNYGNFTFLRIFDAGHMVPFDQPKVSLDMVNRWISGDYSFEEN
ncbi:S10 family peptidase [Ascoidea rubescens DSM 1968]|uniref:Carboxypeptidase n=1 Tax=Ascoidea rubescens DSM 1968 TaxID=1344418 RepID=A0A1D2VB63_9ASCO|nr:carboxypeptidase C [Ascoidea rubescens DSM 1968]ODV58908.1 carboxypeptidase C [Ascoidea rubescens DSM 1968]